jgi:hypothetical protein
MSGAVSADLRHDAAHAHRGRVVTRPGRHRPHHISWAASDAPAPSPPQRPPLQIPYKAPELPGDLTPADRQKLLAILELVKRVAPSDAAPTEVLDVVRKALLAKYAGE